MLAGKVGYLSKLQTLLVFLILNGRAKMKLVILPFLCCGEIVKNSNVFDKNSLSTDEQQQLFAAHKMHS